MGEPSRSYEDTGETSRLQPVFSEGQLSFIGHDASEIPIHLMQEYTVQTVHLDLSFNRLWQLNGLERFTQLKTLVLDNNEIGDDTMFPHIESLDTLSLNKNRITKLDQFLKQIESRFPCLTYLSLLGNTACPNQLSSTDKDDEDYQRYRYYVLFHLPKLKFLDASAVRLTELLEAKRCGQFMEVVRPNEAIEQREPVEAMTFQYSPLPKEGSSESDDQHIGHWGKSRSKYLGKNSEGNRFITDISL
ncbi:leucine-rich melanocyte differentiation-associated protein-like isoform X2 [Pomacea canaliculata]|uniref:leucine-rich melanocyte differentiation-associated protein-like isoform X2 n=1 Tax=Pomacea canaliculata TaxID=400727 RepID=UPI000D73CE1C|nr:leucine-rich melanocyte differentiation-associated protein-like isoform X2 [Pomacea canaliculata]